MGIIESFLFLKIKYRINSLNRFGCKYTLSKIKYKTKKKKNSQNSQNKSNMEELVAAVLKNKKGARHLILVASQLLVFHFLNYTFIFDVYHL